MGNRLCGEIQAESVIIEKKITPIVELIGNHVITALSPTLEAMEKRIIDKLIQETTMVVDKV